jgi:hypothetical protein
VLDEETVVATGKVVEIIKPEVGRVRVQVWLSREDEVVLEGEAEIEISD